MDADKILRQKLADSLAVSTYFELLDCVSRKQVNTKDFRRKFNRFCMVRRGEDWQKIYYGLFSELVERRTTVTLNDILPELDRRIKAKLGSGGTDPGEYVAVNMSLRVKSWCDILRAECERSGSSRRGGAIIW